MRLIALSANVDSFRTVRFNPSGISLIVGGRVSADPNDTFNGVGKSLLIHLVDFCLGSNASEALRFALPGWVFFLDYEMDGARHRVERDTEDQKVILDGEEIGLRDFGLLLGKKVFDVPDGVKQLTFRSLIPSFLRQSRIGYQTFDQVTQKRTTDYQNQVRMALLLGLDTKLVQAKKETKANADTIKKLQASFEKDVVIKDILVGGAKLGIELSEAEDEVNRIRARLDRFEVAENYEDVQETVRASRVEIADKRNAVHLHRRALEQIEESLSVPLDQDLDSVLALYEEASTVLSATTLRSLESVKRFHSGLINSRGARLQKERLRIQGELARLGKEVAFLGDSLDAKMRFLAAHGALNEYTAMSEELAAAVSRLGSLEKYERLVEEYDARLAGYSRDLEEQNVESVEYLRNSKELRNQNQQVFRHFSRMAYPGRKAGIEVENNSGVNQMRFNVDVKIEADSSDGINEVKIMCFDLTLLIRRQNHRVDFVFHDSRLFSDMDPRQRAHMFSAVDESARLNDFQYIASLNQDQLESVRLEMSAEDFKRILEDNVVLRLTDESPEERLLGISVDMRYQ